MGLRTWMQEHALDATTAALVLGVTERSVYDSLRKGDASPRVERIMWLYAALPASQRDAYLDHCHDLARDKVRRGG